VQRRIAGILGAIDDKIENNRRINTNLELQAQALYKQWFVDNRKEDWERKPLSEIAEFIGGYSYKGNELVEASSTAMATIKNFERKGGFKVEGFKDIVASPKLKAEQHAELFDILVAHTDLTQNADVIGNAEILLTFGKYSDIIFSMDLVKVLPKCNFPYKYLLAALLKNPYFKAHCLGYVNGTTVLHMSKKALPEYVVACPSNLEAEKMDGAFKAYYQKMAEILQENETLATLRDTLLPKLMNGEIKL
jgi:type I restriction enzyme S subunit